MIYMSQIRVVSKRTSIIFLVQETVDLASLRTEAPQTVKEDKLFSRRLTLITTGSENMTRRRYYGGSSSSCKFPNLLLNKNIYG